MHHFERTDIIITFKLRSLYIRESHGRECITVRNFYVSSGDPPFKLHIRRGPYLKITLQRAFLSS